METAGLGRLLVTSGLLTQEALDEVLALQKTDGRRITELLADKGLVRPHQLAQFLSHQLACPWVSLQRVEISPEAVEKLPPELARRHHMVPVHLRTSRGGSTALYVAMDDPTDDLALSEATTAAKMPVKPMVALASEIKEQLAELYPRAPAPSRPDLGMTRSEDGALRKVASPHPPGVLPVGGLVTKTSPNAFRPTVSKPPPPLPINKPSMMPGPSIKAKKDDSSIVELSGIEVVEEAPVSQSLSPTIIVIEANDDLLLNVQVVAKKTAAAAIKLTVAEATQAAQNTAPGAIVVAESVYTKEKAAIERIALDSNALLIISNETFEGQQYEGQLLGAVERWRRAAYDQGAVLEGRYELLRDLSGRKHQRRPATWEAKHVGTKRRSIVRIGIRSSESAVRREQAALAKVHHPGALELRDAGMTELGDPFIVVESVEGKTLEGLVAARGALDTTEALSLVRQVAEVLASAHEVGVSHEAVRAEHVIVWRDPWGVERVKLVYWESASVGEAPAPPAHDLAGVGACAFLALAGRAWTEGEDTSAIKDPKIADVVKKALAKEGTMKSFAEALIAAPASGPIRRTSSSMLLAADPEKRGVSNRPPAPAPASSPALAVAVVAETMKEMRKHPRAPYRTPVRVEVPGMGAVDGRSEDISMGGLFVVTRGHIADKAQVTIRFALPIDGKVVSESAIVKWSRAPSEADVGAVRAIGIELVSPSAETTKQIGRYVQFMAVEK
jgi:hypothetical protein